MSLTNLLAESLLGVKQAVRSLNRRRLRKRRSARRASYAEWVARHDTIDDARRDKLLARLAVIERPPRISVLLPTYNPKPQWLREAVASVRAQLYPHWELCIADDASTEPTGALLDTLCSDDARIRTVRRERNGHISAASNSALELATGEIVVLLDHDDVLAPHALLMVAEAARRFPQARLLYSDEDLLGPDGERESPYFKPDWNHELCLSQNMVCHLAAFDAALLREVGGFRTGFEGAQDHDLVLRCVERLAPEQVVHIPHVLYHWRLHPDSTAGASESKPYASEAGRRAVQEHLDRSDVAAGVSAVGAGRYRVRPVLHEPVPSVSIVIPTKNQLGLLRTCIESLTRLTDYPSYELIVVDNGSDDPRALTYLETLQGRHTVRRDPLAPFNFSALNNRAVEHARGEYLVLMNNDIEVIDGDWLREMVAQASRPNVGTVGAKLLYPDRTVQHAGVITGVGRIGHGIAGPAFKGLAANAGGHGGRAKLIQTYSAVTAACLLVRRTLYQQLGGLDEKNLAVAYNDVDFCLRVREAGLRNLWTPYATLIHHESVSRGRDTIARNIDRFQKEAAYMRERWGPVLDHDPAYNPNLSLETSDFALADTPRVSLSSPWYTT